MKLKEKKEVILGEETLWEWGKLVLDDCKMPEKEQKPVLDEVIDCNLRGVDTHGIHLLCFYAQRYKALPPKPIEIVKDFQGVCMVDGGGNLGAVVSSFCMDEAVRRAREYGIGMTLAYDSSHFGAAGYYTRKAAERGYIGYCCTTALIDLAPWGGCDHVVGKNPFSIAFPGDAFPVVLDIACSVTARQRVRTYAREGWEIPDGWALNKNGKPTNDPNEALEGLFLPMGGHKGIGIAVMIEYMIAVICGTGYSSQISANDKFTVKQNSAHMFAAINPLCFASAESIKEQARQFSERYHKVQKLDGVEKVYLPGEIEWDCSQKRKKEGIPVSLAIIKELDAYADQIGISHICDLR
jgi:LDH2 family malate/lactate/ureidoglycolate dehydrogenase